jgi:hypothetical protein
MTWYFVKHTNNFNFNFTLFSYFDFGSGRLAATFKEITETYGGVYFKRRATFKWYSGLRGDNGGNSEHIRWRFAADI